MILKLPLSVSEGQVTLAGKPEFGPPTSSASDIAALEARMAAANPRERKALREQLEKLRRLAARQRMARFKNKLAEIIRMIRKVRASLRTASASAKVKIHKHIHRLMNQFFDLKIGMGKMWLAGVNARISVIKRMLLRRKDRLKAMIARIKRQTVQDPSLIQIRMRLHKAVKGIRSTLVTAQTKKRRIVTYVNKWKARKNIYNKELLLKKAAAGALGSIPQALKNIMAEIKRHRRILNELLKQRRSRLSGRALRCFRKYGSLRKHRMKLRLARGHIVRLKGMPESDKRTARLALWRKRARFHRRRIDLILKCRGKRGNKRLRCRRKYGSLMNHRMKLKVARRHIYRLQNLPETDARKERRALWSKRAQFHRNRIYQILKCRGIRFNICVKKYGSLRMHKYRLRVSRGHIMRLKALPVTNNRTDRIELWRSRARFHRRRIHLIWACACKRATRLFNYYKNKNSPVARQRMNKHRRMMRVCVCRRHRILFRRAKHNYYKFKRMFIQMPTNLDARENRKKAWRNMVRHLEKLMKLNCKNLPRLPRGGRIFRSRR